MIVVHKVVSDRDFGNIETIAVRVSVQNECPFNREALISKGAKISENFL